jgi:hypothetical protein
MPETDAPGLDAASTTYAEGDQCIVCRHWWWDDGKWHSLVPKLYADTPELGRDVICPQAACQKVTGASDAAPSTDAKILEAKDRIARVVVALSDGSRPAVERLAREALDLLNQVKVVA